MSKVEKNKTVHFSIIEIQKINHFEKHFSQFGLDEENLKKVGFELGFKIHVNDEGEKITHTIKAIAKYPEKRVNLNCLE